MSRPSNGSPRRTSLAEPVAAFLGFFVGSILWRLLTHVAGWQQHEFWESLVFALFMGCGAAGFTVLMAHLRR